jgi:crossover junction endodeoxyribonuclease RuvC
VKVAAKLPMAVCLGEIHRAVAAFVADFDPRHVVLEQTIYVQNFQTAQILGAARGAAIAAAALQAKEIFEYAPLRVKLAVVGQGRASKDQMARTVMTICSATAGRWPSTRPTRPAWRCATPSPGGE